MRKRSLALVLTAATVVGLGVGTMLSPSAFAAPVGPLGAAADHLNLIEKSQYVYRGRRHCWYNSGWNGPGWYRCGYATRRGHGWGGPRGWNAWVYSGWGALGPAVVVVQPRGRYYWGGRYYNHRYWHQGRWRYR